MNQKIQAIKYDFFATLQPPKCKLTKEIHALDIFYILYRLTNRHLLNTYSYPH